MKNKIKFAVVAIGLVAILIITILILSSCNKQLIDTTYNFDKAIVSLPNGEVIEGKLTSWKDYENSDQIQVKIDGKTYLVHSTNVVLIKE
jgi:general stress protein CsbA